MATKAEIKALKQTNTNLKQRQIAATKSGDVARAAKYQGMIDTNNSLIQVPGSERSLTSAEKQNILSLPDSALNVPIPEGAVTQPGDVLIKGAGGLAKVKRQRRGEARAAQAKRKRLEREAAKSQTGDQYWAAADGQRLTGDPMMNPDLVKARVIEQEMEAAAAQGLTPEQAIIKQMQNGPNIPQPQQMPGMLGDFSGPYANIAYDQPAAGPRPMPAGPTMNAWGSGADPQFEAAMNARFAQENAQVDAMAAAQQRKNDYFNPFGSMSEYGDLQR